MLRVFDETKTNELDRKTLDFSKGYLITGQIETIIPAIEAQEEKGHYETIAEYPNGGKDIQWIVDQPAIEAQEEKKEIEIIDVYVRFTPYQQNLHDLKNGLKRYQELLNNTDYWALKYMEGYYTEEEYSQKKELRESYRVKVRELTAQIDELEKNNT